MALPALFERYQFDDRLRTWRDLQTGRAVSGNAIRAELDLHTSAARENVVNLTRARYAGQITGEQWELAVAGELKDAHLAQSMFARGGRANMGAAEFGRAGATLREEYRHLRQFSSQIAAGEVTEADAIRRATQYGQATQQSYWKEWGRGQEVTGDMRGLPLLNQTPGDGNTQCHGNCKCFLTYEEDGIHWNLAPAEHCGDCVALAAGGPYRPGRM